MDKKKFIVMTHDEYKANINGLNIFFGAILGVVMADANISSALEYSISLVVIASFIIMLLYINVSEHRLLYAVSAVLILLVVWFKIYQGGQFASIDNAWLEQRLLPTLSVWLGMIVVVEFYPKSSSGTSKDK